MDFIEKNEKPVDKEWESKFRNY